MVETRGKFRYTRLSLGPKGGMVASDSKDIWGNVGVAGRYWFSRKRFAPNLEFTSSLVFKVAGINRAGNFDNVRGPIGFSADIAFGLGGFGSIVVGGQFDSPLAREDVPDVERVSAGGMFFLGFRGNIVWGAPAALAVGTHAITTRAVTAPPEPPGRGSVAAKARPGPYSRDLPDRCNLTVARVAYRVTMVQPGSHLRPVPADGSRPRGRPRPRPPRRLAPPSRPSSWSSAPRPAR